MAGWCSKSLGESNNGPSIKANSAIKSPPVLEKSKRVAKPDPNPISDGPVVMAPNRKVGASMDALIDASAEKAAEVLRVEMERQKQQAASVYNWQEEPSLWEPVRKV